MGKHFYWKAKLRPSEVLQIRDIYRQGLMSRAALGRHYKVSPGLIRLIVLRKVWADI